MGAVLVLDHVHLVTHDHDQEVTEVVQDRITAAHVLDRVHIILEAVHVPGVIPATDVGIDVEVSEEDITTEERITNRVFKIQDHPGEGVDITLATVMIEITGADVADHITVEEVADLGDVTNAAVSEITETGGTIEVVHAIVADRTAEVGTEIVMTRVEIDARTKRLINTPMVKVNR